jgi:hypothetical protein
MAAKQKFVPTTNAGIPIEQSPGKGRKQCPSCAKYISARSEVCPDPECQHVFQPSGKAASNPKTPRAAKASSSEISETAFIKELAGKGFKYVHMVNTLTGEVMKEEKDPKIEKLGLKFSDIPKNSHGEIFVTQTSPEIQVSMKLDKFLEIAGIKP